MTTGLLITIRYKSYDYYDYQVDTNDKYILYKILNNYNSLPGYTKVSKNIVYHNESVNHDQPYIKTHAGSISTGFISCSTLWLNGTSYFSGDTLTLGFHAIPQSGPQFNYTCKYIKQ
jgi:hypothetical protein